MDRPSFDKFGKFGKLGKIDKKKIVGVAVFLAATLIFAISISSMRGCRQPDTHNEYTPDELVGQAEAALAELNVPGARERRRPAIFDSVLRPVDMLLAKAKDAIQDAARPAIAADPREVEERFTLALRSARHARDLAKRGQDLAFALSNPSNPRQFRFPDQQAEASRYVATILWARLQRKYHREFELDPDFQPPADELSPILEEIAAGLAARSSDKELRYLEGTVKLIAGDFAGAADAFGRCAEIDPQYGPAYAGLGNARIMVGDFDRAEKAFLDQVTVGEKDEAAGRGSDALRGGLHNLAMFHDNLAESFIGRAPVTPEDRDRADAHRKQALEYYQRFLRTAGAESDPMAPTARERSAYLGRAAP